jgi:signal transduction histidine kinase/streptogramin lyase
VLCVPIFYWYTFQALPAPTILDESRVAKEYLQQSWHVEDGLPDKRVTSLVQSHDGYLWFGTQTGVVRFDGQKFTVYNHVNTPQFPSDYCISIAEDLDGNLWFAFASGGRLVEKSGDQFRGFADQGPGKSFDWCKVLPSRFGGIWCGDDKAFCRIRGEEVRYYSLPEVLPANPILLDEDERGQLLIGSFTTLVRFDPKSGLFETLSYPYDPNDRTGIALCRGPGQEAWMLSIKRPPGATLAILNAQVVSCSPGTAMPLPEPINDGFRFDPRSYFIVRDQFGNLWLPGDGRGITRYSRGHYQLLPIPHLAEQEFPMSALSDREGNLWIGTDSSGLQRWTPRKVTTYSVKDGLADDNVWTILEAKDGTMWIGTEAGVSHLENDHFTNYRFGGEPVASVVRSIVQDTKGTIWVGTIRLLESIHNGILTEHHLPGAWEETKIRSLLATRDGALLVGTARGLTRIANQQPTKFTDPRGPGDRDIRALVQDRSGDIWVGTVGAGLFRLHEGVFSNWTHTNGLSSDSVWTLYESSEGGLWIGTENGLNLWKDSHLSSFTSAQGLPVNEADSIVEDNYNRIWVSHDHGLYWVPKRQFGELLAGRRPNLIAVHYDDVDGLPTLNFNGQKGNPTGCKTRDGRLWFPSAKGAVVIDPAKVVLDQTSPLTVIEQIRANGRLLLDRTKPPSQHGNSGTLTSSRGTHPEPLAARLKLLHGKDSSVEQLPPGGAKVLEFRYTSPTFLGADKVRFRFRLVGLSDQWIDADARREAYFTDLRPGNYRFEVIAGNHHGVWQEKGASFGFTLAPHFYESSWFYVVCGLVVLTVGLKLFTWRAAELQKIHLLEQHKALAEQRERFARDVHDELGSSLTQIVGLAEVARANAGPSDPLIKRVHQIGSVAKGMVASIGEIVWVTNPKYDTLFDLVGYLREYCAEYFAHIAMAVDLKFPDNVPAKNVTGLFRRHLLLLTKEALQNVAKHAHASRVEVRLELIENELQLFVIDNGRGLSSSADIQKGQGMHNMQDRVSDLGGTLSVSALPEGGTAVQVRVPLPENSVGRKAD